MGLIVVKANTDGKTARTARTAEANVSPFPGVDIVLRKPTM